MKRLFLTSAVIFVADHIVRNIGTKGQKLLFVTTASEVETGDLWWLRDDRKGLVDAGFEVTDYTISEKSKDEIVSALHGIDAICFSGGNTFYLLQQIQQSGCADVLSDVVEKGMIYIGTSAGSVIAGPDTYPVYPMDDVRKAPKLSGYKGLGLVDFVVFPHWGSEDFRESYIKKGIPHAYTTNHKIILLTNNQYVRVEGEMYMIEEVKKK